jgi:hypothetical protein
MQWDKDMHTLGTFVVANFAQLLNLFIINDFRAFSIFFTYNTTNSITFNNQRMLFWENMILNRIILFDKILTIHKKYLHVSYHARLIFTAEPKYFGYNDIINTWHMHAHSHKDVAKLIIV